MNHFEHKKFAEVLFEQVRTQAKIDSATFAGLSSIYPTILTAALEILDTGKVTKFQT